MDGEEGCVEGRWGERRGRKYVAGVSASPGHCSLSITSIVRFREAGEKREVGIYAEFPVFVAAVGLFFPSVAGLNGRIKSHLFGLEIATRSCRRWITFTEGLTQLGIKRLYFNAPFPSPLRHLSGA